MSRSRSRSRDPSLQPLPSALSSAARGGPGNHTGDIRPSFELGKLEEEDKRVEEHKEPAQ